MKSIKIKTSILFWVFCLVYIAMGKALLFVNYMLVLFIHEYAHAFVAYRLGYQITNIKVIPFGISLNMQSSKLNPKDQILIAIAGPLINLACVVILVALWWVLPISYNYTNLFCFASLTTALFNFIPCFPLDGGRVLMGFVDLKSTKKLSYKLCTIVNLIFATLIFSMFIVSIFFSPNISMLLVSVFIFCNSLIKEPQSNYEFLTYSNKFDKKQSYPIKQVAVEYTLPIYKLCTYVNNNVLVHFVVMQNSKPIFSFYETQLNKIYHQYSPTQQVCEIKHNWLK